METLIHANIFFFITSIAVVILGILITIVLIYIATILADIKAISRLAKSETANIATDIHEIRGEIKDELRRGSSMIGSIIKIIQGLFRRRKSRNKSN